MAPPSKKATELVAYLVQTQPQLLEVKSLQRKTPLMLACSLGRANIVKVLIKSGADQSTKDIFWHNLLHAALEGNPTADKLKPFLQLLDRDLLISMVAERCSGGRTPLHKWVSQVVAYTWNCPYKNAEVAVEVLELLLGISTEGSKRALRMLDTSGDSALHSLMFRDTDVSLALAREIVRFDPELLFQENAVGRTPAEIAHDRFATKWLAPSPSGRSSRHISASVWISQAPSAFVKTEEETREHEDTSNTAKLWHLCEEAMAGFPRKPKRRLVSLHEAHEVAQRLGEEYMRSRYLFRWQFRTGDEDDEENGEEDESTKTRQKSKRRTDFVATTSAGHVWENEDEN